MDAVQSGTGHAVVVSTVTYREHGPFRLPLPVQFAADEARATLGDGIEAAAWPGRTAVIGGRGDPVARGPAVTLDGPVDDRRRPSECGNGPGCEPTEADPSFAVGLHAASVGDGDPLSLRSAVGMRALAPGHYRDVTVPIWHGNPYPIVAPRRPGERPRTHWTDVDLVPDRTDRATVELTATLWDGGGPGDDDRLHPVADILGRPVTSTATVTFERPVAVAEPAGGGPTRA